MPPPTPRRWLVKTEPSAYSYADLERDGTTTWEGVANALALIHLRAMQAGDDVLVYHTGVQRSVVGLARVAKAPYPDPALKDPKRVVVDLTAVARAKTPVPIAAMRAEEACSDLALLRLGRLSVMPVPDAAWDAITKMAGL
jgi:predicted RNA-binding protein with PUA-like domain